MLPLCLGLAPQRLQTSGKDGLLPFKLANVPHCSQWTHLSQSTPPRIDQLVLSAPRGPLGNQGILGHHWRLLSLVASCLWHFSLTSSLNTQTRISLNSVWAAWLLSWDASGNVEMIRPVDRHREETVLAGWIQTPVSSCQQIDQRRQFCFCRDCFPSIRRLNLHPWQPRTAVGRMRTGNAQIWFYPLSTSTCRGTQLFWSQHVPFPPSPRHHLSIWHSSPHCVSSWLL